MADEVTINQLLSMQHEQISAVLQQIGVQNATATSTMEDKLSQVSQTMLRIGAMGRLPTFSEKGKVTDWIQEVDKCRAIYNLTDGDTCQLAWEKTSGTVSRLVGRKLKENPRFTWAELKELLETEYGTVVDRQQAFINLTGVRQQKEEGVAGYTERFLAMTGKAYGEEWRSEITPLVEGQLVSIFMEGLRSRELKLRMYRKGTTTINEAIAVAKSEDLSKKRFPGMSWRRASDEEEPMEVDKVRRGGCFQCGGPHRSKDCRQQRTLQRPQRVQAIDNRAPRQLEEDRLYRRCFRCHKVGHFRAQCRAPLN